MSESDAERIHRCLLQADDIRSDLMAKRNEARRIAHETLGDLGEQLHVGLRLEGDEDNPALQMVFIRASPSPEAEARVLLWLSLEQMARLNHWVREHLPVPPRQGREEEPPT